MSSQDKKTIAVRPRQKRAGLLALAVAACLWSAGECRAGLLSGQGVFVLDPGGTQRSTFSNNERVVLQQRIFNSVVSANRISFRFVLISPTGTEVFTHAGNAVPGSVGNAASQVSGVPVSQFYTGPGFYTLRAEAELDGQILQQQVQFSVSSPNILLIYPPNSARDVADNPLTFRWSASGATRYRVQVGDNPSLYNSLFTQETSGAENFLSYPQNPSDTRQRLATGQVYYWTVEGLDPSGNTIAKSEAPFNFSVQSTSMAKDLAVQELAVEGVIGPDGALQLRVRVANQGNTMETGINLKVSVGGLPAAGTPMSLSLFSPSESREFTLQAFIPVDQKQTLATACLELFDDNVTNNCKTLAVTKPESPTGAATPIGSAILSADQMWQMLQQLLQERGIDVNGWEPAGPLDPAQLSKLIDGLRQGSVQVTVTGAAPPPPVTIGTVAGASRAAPEFGNAPDLGVQPEEEEPKLTAEQLWTELDGLLRKLGHDIGNWEPAVKLKAEDLERYVKGLKDGSVTAAVTGPPPAAAAPPATAGSGPENRALALLAEAERAQPAEGGIEELPEWTGMGPPAGKAVQAKAIKAREDWDKTWRRLQEGRAPKLDFKRSIVVGIIGGSEDRADRIEIEGIQIGTEGLLVRYRLLAQDGASAPLQKGKRSTRVPFILKQVQASPGLEVRFERVGAQ